MKLDSQEARAAPAVFAAAPVIAQQAQHAQQAHPSSRSPQLDGDQDRIAAVAAAPTQLRADTTCAPTPQAAAPTKSQTPTGAPDSPTVHKSAESIVARQPVRAASKAAAKAASQGKSVDVKEGEDDTELAPEEMGFAGHSDDAFAGKNSPTLRAALPCCASSLRLCSTQPGAQVLARCIPSQQTACRIVCYERANSNSSMRAGQSLCRNASYTGSILLLLAKHVVDKLL